jgi:NADPH-dependent 2,4-dienoyl-CoA reductase/sulfur reductase-like enzyme/rhodanese-related sulfurtransferase
MTIRIIIVGGVAGGASCAARLRRLDEQAEIVMYERGPYVSFANCGLPYHIGGIIADEAKLLVATPKLLNDRFRIQVKVHHEIVAIDRPAQTLTVRDLESGREFTDRYDYLVLSPGATAIIPAVPGVDLPGVFTVRTVPDARAVRAWIDSRQATRALVVGGGFIGLEMCENLRHRDLDVTLVEKADQVMPPLDPEMAAPVRVRLEESGVVVMLSDAATAIRSEAGALRVGTERGADVVTDLVILAIGVRPETTLPMQAGLELGPRGGIKVDAQMRTSDPRILAVGDAVEVVDLATGAPALIPLAGPANRQGRLAADIINGRTGAFRGVQGTAVCGVFGLTVAMTGASEKSLRRAGAAAAGMVYLHPTQHVGYYPGAKPIHLKLLYRKDDGRVLGAQAVGEDGVERRIDVIATAMRLGATVEDLADLELCYAPQYGAAKDPVNLAGMVAANDRDGDAPVLPWSAADDTGFAVLDVREPGEWAAGHHERALHIPLHQVRGRLTEIPRDRPLAVYCAGGQRSYYAVRLLRQNGFDARNLSGGWLSARYLAGAIANGKQARNEAAE